MSYRQAAQDKERDEREAARAKLARLAAEGAAKSDALGRVKRAAAKSAAAEARRERDKCFREALIQDDVTFIVLLLALVVVGGGGGAWLAATAGSVSVQVAGWVTAGLSIVGAVLIRFPLGRRAMRKELAWLRSLPFNASSYETVLRVTPHASCTIEVELRFQDPGSMPDERTLSGLLGRADAGQAKVAKDRARFASASISCSQNDGPDTNVRVRRWMHKLITDALLPLHEAYPLTEVRFKRD